MSYKSRHKFIYDTSVDAVEDSLKINTTYTLHRQMKLIKYQLQDTVKHLFFAAS